MEPSTKSSSYKKTNKNSKKIKLLSILPLLLLLFSLSHVESNAENAKKNYAPFGAEILSRAKEPSKTKDISSLQNISSLPIASVKKYEADDKKGTIVFLPQYHRSPASSIEDKENDKAAKLQQESYEIINYLVKEQGIKSLFVEGELTGNVSDQKRSEIQNLLSLQQQLSQSKENLSEDFEQNSYGTSTEKQAMQEIESLEALLKRQIYLGGASQLVWANSDHVQVIGTENKKTQDESRVIVRNYIYLKDRLTQLGGNENSRVARTSNSIGSLSGSNVQALLELLSSHNGTQENAFNFLKVNGSPIAKKEIKILESIKKTMKEIDTPKSATPTPSRSDNPFATVNNIREIQNLMEENENQLNRVVIDQRNKDTAMAVANELLSRGESSAILQFGAGHTDELVTELNKQGLSVIVIETNELAVQKSN